MSLKLISLIHLSCELFLNLSKRNHGRSTSVIVGCNVTVKPDTYPPEIAIYRETAVYLHYNFLLSRMFNYIFIQALLHVSVR